MQSPPNMPQFGGPVPILGQQNQQQPSQQQQMQAQVQAAIGQVSLGIYSHLATAYITTRDEHQSIDQDQLRQLAKESQIAAKCYFEGIGVIAQNPQEDSKEAP